MCGRFVSASPPEELAAYFDAAEVVGDRVLDANYNVAPTDDVYVVLVDEGVRRLATHRWGLVPPWADDLRIGARMINARAETVAERNGFKQAFAARRCLVPADGFYEWQARLGEKRKEPMFIHRVDGEPFAFAGLWERWRSRQPEPEGGAAPWVRSCSIITGAANDTVAPVHDRMPVALPRSAWATWLDPEVDDLNVLRSLLVAVPPEQVTVHPVSSRVNDVRHDGPDLVEPVALPDDDAAASMMLPGMEPNSR